LFVEGDGFELTRDSIDKMPIFSLPVTLAEVLKVRGTALNDAELWALLYATSQSLLDLFMQGRTMFGRTSE